MHRSPSPDGGAVFKSDGVPVSDGSIDCVVPVAQLTPGQKYFYSVGFFSEMLATGAALSFTTLPPGACVSPVFGASYRSACDASQRASLHPSA